MGRTQVGTWQKRYDVGAAISKYEESEMSEEEVIDLFQHLVDSGLAWQLQGSYGRMAKQLIDEGFVRAR